ncbi:MerR family transcriptional regulator [Streptomyces sp. AJS327]|uniref:MerR family transcriptional regulator n=1 Tax=Streptomyces sp. AJS327 TaxID=2545265 RepID=UPI0015E04F3A|nr:MerR family transcriptional regulator [Streptomyces sp. AJS327]MBA0053913.1 MerR family transcriptional regulator [Streptomyces sp. AJS327]
MFTIGDFARHGSVSVRMLRHYDAIGLLRPAHTDPVTGYRFYEAAQLSQLNRVIALKDLGFTLDQVRSILDERVDVEHLCGMLRLRRAEQEAAVAEGAARLTRVEVRLRTIQREGHMNEQDVVVKTLPPVRVAELSGTAEGFGPEHIGPVIQPLYEELFRRLERAGVTPSGPGVAYYECAEDDVAVTVHAGVTVSAAPDARYDFDVVDLPGVERAATTVHHGSMDRVAPTHQALGRWIEANGYRSYGNSRELTLECDGDPETWVTELQEPVVPA